MANDILTRDVIPPFGNYWLYIVDEFGNIEGISSIDDILALGPGESNTSSNVGTGAPLAKAKNGDDLPFRTLSSLDGSVIFTQNTDEIDIKAVRVGVYKNIYVDAGAMIGRFTNGATTGTSETPTNKIMNDYFEFANGVDSFVQFSVNIPDAWDLNDVKFKFYWTNSTVVGAGEVSWGVNNISLADGDAIDTAMGAAVQTIAVFDGVGTMNISSASGLIPVSNNPAIGTATYFQVGRYGTQVGDTYTEPARLLRISIQYKESLIEPAEW